MRPGLEKAETTTLLVTQVLSCSIGGFFFFSVNKMIGSGLHCLKITMVTTPPPTTGWIGKATLGRVSQGGVRRLTPSRRWVVLGCRGGSSVGGKPGGKFWKDHGGTHAAGRVSGPVDLQGPGSLGGT